MVFLQGFTIENEGLRTYLIYRPQSEENIDVFGRGMLMANHIEGIIPVMPDSDSTHKIRYDITDMTEIEAFLSEGIGMRQQMDIFEGVLRSILGAERYLLDSSMFVMNMNYVYIDRNTGAVQLIYLPVTRAKPVHKINERIRILFRDMIFTIRYSPKEDNRHVAELINGLNNKSEFSPSEFFRIIKKFDDGEVPDTAADDTGLEKETVLSEYTEESESQTLYVYSESSEGNILYSDNADSKKDSVFGHLKKIFFSKQDSKSSDDTYMDYYNSESADELNVAETVKDNYDCFPYMIRLSNGEKIVVDSDVFNIGKAGKDNNYRISDNVAVSASHAEIVTRNGHYYVSDLDSLNYTYVNGDRIGSNIPKKLESGDIISFADEEFKFYC